ncbi:cell adhesion molecule CEACAM1-like [Littorina saxatilis]|uniref:cell adhesion molecule CEACAM1-like n=1 Tax=Littorina saxatilis TaxID=31220 RepID=UPI0038B54BE2
MLSHMRALLFQRPTTPSISCSPTPVPENNNVSCTCTANVGQPAGSLRWLSGSKNNFITNSPLLTGDSPLVLTRQLTRGDHDVTQFRCDVLWSSEIKSSDSYTADVGYPPSGVTLRINSSQTNQDVVVLEHGAVTFTCSATGGNPAADVTLSGPGLQSTPVTSQVPHVVPDVQCGDSGSYRCTARNKFGPEQVASATLYVKCKPHFSSTRLPPIRFTGKAPSVVFNVTAYPGPTDSLTFGFLGSSAENSAPQTDYKGIEFGSSCQAVSNRVNLFTCVVTVYSIIPAVVGFYQVTASNPVGSTALVIEILLQDPETSDQNNGITSSSASGVTLGLGGVLALVVVISVVFFVWVWKRRWILPCADLHSINNSKRVQYEAKRSTDQNFEVTVTQSSLPRAPEGPYESLDMSEVAQRSIYSEISPDVAKA